jgi:hypothetical protein
VFFGFDTKMKNLELCGKTFMPVPNMMIVREANGPMYFIELYGKQLIDLQPNTLQSSYHINIVPIGKFA